MWPTRPDRQAGFSLLEILVAFVILATVITVALQIFGGGLRNLQVSDDYVAAVTIAEARLAEVGRAVPVAVGEDRGSWEGYSWVVQTAPFKGMELAATGGAALYEVAVTVRWGEGRSARSLTLNTLRLGPAQEGGA